MTSSSIASTTVSADLTVTAPSGATVANNYSVTYCVYLNRNPDTGGWQGPSSAFDVIPPPAPRPSPAAGPAFPWQGSVGGVNTGNGNKMTVLPLTGWTMRGGMAVSCALIHNSQNALYGQFGDKWLVSYQSWLTKGGGGNVIVHWDNGQSYPFNVVGPGSTYYNQPLGINQTLTYNSSDNSYNIVTQGKTKFHFVPLNGSWYLSSISDINGNTLTVTRTSTGNVSTVADQASPPRTLTYGYDGTGRLSTVTDPLNRTWTLNYDGSAGSGNLWYVVDPPIGSAYSYRAFGYDTSHNITLTQDHNNNHATFGYNTADGSNSLAWARDPVANQAGSPATTFAYGPATTTITDPNGHATIHTYSVGLLLTVTDALSKAESYGYDWNNVQDYKQDRRLNPWTTGYTYQAHTHNVTASISTSPLGEKTSSTADAYGKPLTQTDGIGNVTRNIYSTDGLENLTETDVTGTDGVARKSYVGGYANGLPTTFTDANSHSSSVIYDPNGWGYVTSATDANNITTRATYNALGWKLTSTDGVGRVTRYTYDPWGRVTVVTAPDGTQTGTAYDPNGNVVRIADADAYAATPLYAVHCYGNAVGRFTGDAYYSGGSGSWAAPSADTSGVAAPAPTGLYTTARIGAFSYTFPSLTPGRLYTLRLHFVESGYNAPGQRLFNVAINGGPCLTNFDIFAAAGAMNKAYIVEGSVAANGSGQIVVSFTLGAADVPVCSGLEVLPYVHTVNNNYDADDRLTSTFAATGTGNGDMVSYAYDGVDPANGNVTQKGLLSSKTDGNGHTTRYSYTARSEPSATFYPDGTSESVTYDANGNTLSRTKPDGKVIGYAYDADNRLTDITYPTLPAVHFDYDADSRRTHMHDGVGDTSWTFGDGLHLTHLASNRGDVFYSYDAGSRRTSMTGAYVNPGSPYSAYVYGYDAGSRLISLTNPFNETTSFLYNNDGTVQKKTLANGAYMAYTYDPLSSLMTGIQYVGSGLGGSYYHSYTYEPNGSLSSRSESDGGTNSFGYDGMGQLVSEVRTGGVPFTHAYTYDHNGNRLTQSVNGSVAQSFSYDAHDKLTGGIGESETYDANGNLTAQTVNGQTTRFTWDDEDRLTGQTFPDGHSDTFTYTGLGMRLRKSDPTGNYWYLCDGVSPASPVLSDGYTSFTPGLSEISGAGSRFYLPDAQGNSRGLLDNSQGNTDGYNWDGFGNLISRGGSNPTAFAWNVSSGYQSDNDSGLKLLGHRYYDSRIGRFITQDPIGDGNNWYAYCDNNPVNLTDPLGLVCPDFNSTGMSFNQVYDHVTDNGGLPGETYTTLDKTTGNVLYQFTVSGITIGNTPFVAPYGQNIDGNINAAKNFMASTSSKSPYHYGWHGGQTGLRYDVNKIAAWLIKNVDTGHGQDYKKVGKQYDSFGHVNYAAVANHLRFSIGAIILGQEFVHLSAHGLGSGLEGTELEYIGSAYDQRSYNPGPALFDEADAAHAFLNYKYGL